jgi:hypothetical protein
MAHRLWRGSVLVVLSICSLGAALHAQDWKPTSLNDTSALKPPAGVPGLCADGSYCAAGGE